MADTLPVHPALAPLAFLIGSWAGTAEGVWVEGEPIQFRDEIEFAHVGKPYLSFRQQSWHADGAPSHGESGYLAISASGTVTLTVAQPSGIVEVHAGTIEDGVLRMACVAIGLGPEAKRVTGAERTLHLDGEELHYRLRIAMNGEPLADHILGRLSRGASRGG